MKIAQIVTIGILLGNVWIRPAFAGPGASGGGDATSPWAGMAWFQDKTRSVKACYVVSDHFSASNSLIKSTILEAFEVWNNYLSSGPDRHINVGDISSQVQVIPCDGSEDLKFYFGVADARVEEGRKEFFEPLAFSHRELDGPIKWGRGIIWVADAEEARRLLMGRDWSTSDILKGILIHELGHVFGCQHFAETIMREDIVDFIKLSTEKSASVRKAMMSSVDWGDFLVTPITNFEYAGTLEAIPFIEKDRVFKTFMARPSQGPVSAKFLKKIDADLAETHLIISDSIGTADFPIKNSHFLGNITRGGTIFKTYHGERFQSASSIVTTSFSQIEAKDGQIYTLYVQLGGAEFGDIRSPIQIVYTDKDNTEIILFMAYPGGQPFVPLLGKTHL